MCEVWYNSLITWLAWVVSNSSRAVVCCCESASWGEVCCVCYAWLCISTKLPMDVLVVVAYVYVMVLIVFQKEIWQSWKDFKWKGLWLRDLEEEAETWALQLVLQTTTTTLPHHKQKYNIFTTMNKPHKANSIKHSIQLKLTSTPPTMSISAPPYHTTFFKQAT